MQPSVAGSSVKLGIGPKQDSGVSISSAADSIDKPVIKNLRPEDIPFQRAEDERELNPERINLNRKSLQSCVILSNEERLRLLNYQTNSITKIEHLDNLRNLVFLDFYNNAIEKIEGLDYLSNLRVLMLGRNKIQKIEGLESLSKLDVLDLHANQITTVENLEPLTSLRVLNLEDNSINTLHKLPIPTLAELNLKRNQIQTIHGIQSLVNLKRLVLSNNSVASFENIIDLLLSTTLLELSLEGNPITADQYYRLILANRIKTLKYLDGKRISEEEKRTALKIAKRETERRKETERVLSQAEERKKAVDVIKRRWNLDMEIERKRHKGFMDYMGKASVDDDGSGLNKKGKPSKSDEGAVGGLIYTEGNQMFLYGNDSLSLFEKAETTGITTIYFQYIDIKKLAGALAKVKRFFEVDTITFSDNNMNSLKKIEVLSQLSVSKPLTVVIENNAIIDSPFFFHYTLFRLCRFSHHNVIKTLNGTEITSEMLDEAVIRFGVLRAGLLKTASMATMESFSREFGSDGFDATDVRPRNTITRETQAHVDKLLTEVVEANAKALEFERLWPLMVKAKIESSFSEK
ncbi:L domain-like protein [Rhizoclosmatium globosum]|uniref:L domain-like protein n=1 Tax=Rhizoclosmatium globosum TaxID=329046 RepID=A0A1Y2CJN0_9FUNG|nr:L domain-like protein [Rhizoclosmatium globosum]|eukprot:ORY47054.1 L domain-like protein [Rhizoclosmatium globosum]